LVNEFIDHVYHTVSELQVIKAPPLISTLRKSPQHPLNFPACCVFTSHSQATASYSGDSSVPLAQFLPSRTLVENCLPAVPSGTRLNLLITFRNEPHRKYCFYCYSPTIPSLLLALRICCHDVFTEPLPRNCSGIFAHVAVIE
jgi:hypothetical protein